MKATVVKKIEIAGVDPEAGNPEIRVMSTGSLILFYQMFPPAHVETDEQALPYATFDGQLERFLGVPVEWVDRELFHIESPRPGTIAKPESFVRTFPSVPAE